VLTKGAERFEVTLTRDQFAQAGQVLHREIARLLHELRPAGAPVTLVAPSVLDHLPGLREELEQFVDCELITVRDGFAATVASRLDLPDPAGAAPVRLLRRLPAITPEPQLDVSRVMLGSHQEQTLPPSHLLLNGQVYALGGEPLVIGRSPMGPRTIPLADGLAGVSRRHCTLTMEGGELILLDHSSFGTYVNGERVAERVRVRAGDRVRIGDPGIEFALIAVNETSGVRASK
jgi:hypothetical protein